MSVVTKLNVLRGYPTFDSNALTLSAVPKTSEAILSGMLINLDLNNQWVKGKRTGMFPAWAIQDQDAPDVSYSGKLSGLIGLFGYEIETPYVTSGNYQVGTFVTNSTGTPGSITETCTYPATNDVVGLVSRGKYVNKDGNTVVALFTVFYPVTSTIAAS